ncbi:MAG TPA: hypothetical protein VEL07_04990 [Planctomycetota bacterium]|nr:hypothetical protein [Planctomycetota bacterium]
MIRPLALGIAVALLLGTGCSARSEPRVVDGVAYGTTRVQFRDRWWHFYERGLSWAAGGFHAEAEADLRACLKQRASDSRRARTYGCRFVQCFAHRELAAVLIATGRLDEAADELRLSLAQEPSAKAEYLLRQITSAGGPLPGGVPSRLTLASLAPAAGGVAVAGRWQAALGTVLWLVPAAGAPQPVPTAADGTFAVTATDGSALATGPREATEAAQLAPLADIALPPAAPRLRLDGPTDGDAITGACGWWRWHGEAAGGLARLRVLDGEGATLRELALSGVGAGGMVDVPLPPGEHALAFELVAADGAIGRTTVSVTARPTPDQDRRLRATALLLPLMDPRAAAGARAPDDAGVQAAVVGDARLRLIDRRVDGRLERELALADAGWIAPGTAARAGGRLGARYCIAGTVGRGHGDIECWLRLIHVATGEVVATADAYAIVRDAGDEDAFYAAVAARLRQAFPVLSGGYAGLKEELRLDLGERDGVVELMRFHLVDGEAERVVGTVEVVDARRESAEVRVIDGAPGALARAISE